ncbi:MAG: ECF transporter S component [Peptoniphilaceae bacterium]|nr:ECF transporter S component [Peptoniphilaceae bacterium]MDY6018941.1 ECF transporter S component [Anaerococcus sp.]
MNNKKKTRQLVITAMLGAITIVLGLTPLGFIPLGFINITTMHIPVIIAAIVEGPLVGGIVGLLFGLSSMANAVLRPGPISFVFYNPLIAVVPRILIGLVSAYVYKALKNKDNALIRKFTMAIWIIVSAFLISLLYKNINGKKEAYQLILSVVFLLISLIMLYLTAKYKDNNFAIAISSFLGTMTNSILVLGLIYLLYAEKYVARLSIPVEAARSTIFGAIITNGIPEAILSIVLVSAVVKSLKRKR